MNSEVVPQHLDKLETIHLLFYDFFQFILIHTVRLSSSNISGAIHPSVPAAPDRRENEILPAVNFLHKPKSDMRALTFPPESG